MPEKAVEVPVLTVDVESNPEQAAKDDEEKAPPRFIKPLKNCQVNENEPVTLEAVVEGLPEPHVCWEFEGKPLVENDCVFTENEGNFFRFVCPRRL